MTRRRSSVAWLTIAALSVVSLAACGGGDTVDGETPTTNAFGRFPAAVVPTSEPIVPIVATPLGVPGSATSTTATTLKPVAIGATTTPTTVAAPPARVRPAATPMPSPRTAVGSAAWQGLVVVAGGIDATNHLSARVDAYDPSTGDWTRAPDLPQALARVALAVQDGDLWAVGGFSAQGDQKIAQATTYHFHPGDRVWKTGPALSTPRAAAALGALTNTLIVIGGATTDGGTLDSVETLALGDAEWKTATPVTQKRAYATAIVGGGRIYAVGGQTEGVSSALDNVESWKPGDAWRAEMPLNTKRTDAGASALCVAGGQNGDGIVSTVECIATRKWSTKFLMAIPRHGLAAVTLDGWLHLVGGSPTAGPSVNAAHEIFDLQA